jgi:hypothetical protein
MCTAQYFLTKLLDFYTFTETNITRKIYLDIAVNFAFPQLDEGKVRKFSARRTNASLQR